MADNTMTFEEFEALTRGAQPNAARPDVTYDEFEALTRPEPAPSVNFGEDVGRSAMAGVAGGAARAPGIPGDIGRAWPSALGWAYRKIGAPEEAAQALERGIGAISPLGYLPSSKQTEGVVKKALPSVGAVMDYQPQTTAGKYAKSAGEEAPLALIPGGGFGLAARLTGAAASGVASEGARQAFKGKPGEGTGYQTAAEIAAPLLAGPSAMFGARGIGRAADTVTSPMLTALSTSRAEKQAAERLGRSLGVDLATDQSGMGKAASSALREAAETGVSPNAITPAQLAGPETRKVAVLASGKTPEAISDYNSRIAQGAAEANEDMRVFLANKVGRSELVFSNEMNAIDDLKSAVNNKNYTDVMALPEAQNIPTSTFKALFGQPLFRSQWDEANSVAASLKDKYGLKIPNQTQEGNLAYWDFMKRHFDRLGAAETVGTKADAYREIAKKIRDSADTVVSSYKTTRDEAAEIFGFRNAMEMGREYLNLSNNRWKNISAIERDALNKMGPQELERVRLGAAIALTEKMITPKAADDVMRLYDQLGSSEMQRRLTATFGEAGKDEIIGRATQNAMKAKAQAIDTKNFPPSLYERGKEALVRNATGAGAIAGAVPFLQSVVSQQALFSPDWKNLTAIAAGAIYGKAVSSAETKIAEQVLRLLNSPEGTVRIGKLLSESASARSFMRKMDGFLEQAAVAGIRSQAGNATRPERAFGGRAGGMTADMLIAAAERAKKAIGKDTEALLSTPDASVAKALAVANQKLEG